MDKMEKVKKKMAKNLTLPHGDLNPGFLNKTFLPKIWILREIRSIELTEGARFSKNLNFTVKKFECDFMKILNPLRLKVLELRQQI